MNINTNSQIDAFKEVLDTFYNNIKDNKGTEENIKKHIEKFLENAFYNDNEYVVNTFYKIDSAIKRRMAGVKEEDLPTLVIIEVKRPSNTGEMYSDMNRNCKALHELLRYFDIEYYNNNNKNITYLIITDGFNWYFFDAKKLIKLVDTIRKHNNYKSYNDKIGAKNTTNMYYDMAKECLNNDDTVYHNDYYSLHNRDEESVLKLYNILHPSHLLKDNSAYTDSNILDERFYNELLYLMGLYENDDKIERRRVNEREKGSLIELIYSKLDKDKDDEELFDIAFGLCVLWINRMLFIKLLEARLLEYYKKDGTKKILHIGLIKDFSSLSTLFFNILGTKIDERDSIYTDAFGHIPYLNSLLFEETEPMNISRLDNGIELPYYTGTLIKNTSHTNSFLGYFFDFLESYNFSYDEDKTTQDDEKPLMTASVLGLVFEKLNGYKEGSFYTPSFITAYMCDDVLERTVVDKYNKELYKDYKSIRDIQNDIQRDRISIATAREIYNKIRVLDPSVGSGHFSVATLNKLLMMKYELGLLEYKGSTFNKNEYELKNYKDDIYLYSTHQKTPLLYTQKKTPERQKMQEILFHEKQCIIENNIFGVDINPKSVHICQLRLWIELLKHAYFREDNTMETLPNIDINIKKGDSLFARNSLSIDIKNIDGGSNIDMEAFRNDIVAYRKESNKKARKDIEKRIKDTEYVINKNAVDMQCQKYEAILAKEDLFGDDELLKQQKKEAQERINTIRKDELWDKSFEWRYKFPEVLDTDTGAFIGFDCIIGNPPYFSLEGRTTPLSYEYYKTYKKNTDICCLFIEKALELVCPNGYISFITTNKWLRTDYGYDIRKLLSTRDVIKYVDLRGKVFKKAAVDTSIMTYRNAPKDRDNTVDTYVFDVHPQMEYDELIKKEKEDMHTMSLIMNDDRWSILNDTDIQLKQQIEKKGIKLKNWKNIQINRGVLTGYNGAFIIDNDIKNKLIEEDKNSIDIIKPILRGRDIKRYGYVFADKYILQTGYDIDIENKYKAVYNHLLQYKEALIKRHDKGKNWYNLRACSYYKDFEKEKIVYQELTQGASFAYSHDTIYVNNSAYIMTGKDIKYMLAMLNSTFVGDVYKSFYSTTLGTTGVRWLAKDILELPIPIPTDAQKKALEELVDKRLEAMDSDIQQQLEDDIEALVRELYGIS